MRRKGIFVLSIAAITLFAAVPAVAEQGEVIVRLRGIAVAPVDDGANGLVHPGNTTSPTLPTSSVGIATAYTPEIDISYFLTQHFAVNAIGGTSEHGVYTNGGLAGLGQIASAWVLPPTITLTYHPFTTTKFQPYAGIGFVWAIFYNGNATQSLVNAAGPTKVHVDNDFNFAAQVGTDYYITKHWLINADLKYLNIHSKITLATSNLGTQVVGIPLRPLVVGIGLGYKF